jgi:hypothetical protein
LQANQTEVDCVAGPILVDLTRYRIVLKCSAKPFTSQEFGVRCGKPESGRENPCLVTATAVSGIQTVVPQLCEIDDR